MARAHYVRVRPGDEVWIDLGGHGLVARLDGRGRYCDVVCVGYARRDGRLEPYLVPADMVVGTPADVDVHRRAEQVRIMSRG